MSDDTLYVYSSYISYLQCLCWIPASTCMCGLVRLPHRRRREEDLQLHMLVYNRIGTLFSGHERNGLGKRLYTGLAPEPSLYICGLNASLHIIIPANPMVVPFVEEISALISFGLTKMTNISTSYM